MPSLSLILPVYEPFLFDYAFYPLINSTQPVQAMFAYKSPEAILYQQVTRKSDVYCLGIIILEILTGKFPFQYLNNQKGGTNIVQWVWSAVSEKRETELIDPEIASTAATSLAEMEKLI
ncbi:Pollen receptor-like kinase 6 [Camellia lanceoleosa]|uniref:Pollen receptor-like kinase 6 n=1 Tax=Camellia lanceoleosa TaxID=1840588 RepID=A0ACC0F775_9ERIC|nr:Pollen receptor-like kinase 6 [Camellia lanceoleosa]